MAIHDERNAARRKKTRFHGALWLGIGMSLGHGKNKMNRRDSFQRKAYAIHRMSSAEQRLIQATTEADRVNARGWIAKWSAVSGIRMFRLGNGGGRSKKSGTR
jgi:hypothetical protein